MSSIDTSGEGAPDSRPASARETGGGAPRRPHLADVLVPVFVFAFCIVVGAMALNIDTAPPAFVGTGMQPKSFPLFLMAIIAALNVVLIRETFRDPPERREPLKGIVWISAGLMGVFAAIAEFADMMLGLAVVIFAMSLLWGERRIWVALLLALLTPATILLFFDIVLEVRFPRGLITNLYYG